MGKMRSLLCWFWLLFFFAGPVYGGVQGFDQQFETGKQLFASQAYQKAAALFFQLFRQHPDNPEVNFYLGRAAFESGDYETAVMAYERVLIADPSAVTAKLELAKSFYRLGAESTAVLYFRELLDEELPAEVRSAIEALLATSTGEGQ